jgi:hypothetical protein
MTSPPLPLQLLVFLVSLAGCSQPQASPSSASSTLGIPSATPTRLTIQMYRVSDVGKSGVPTMRGQDRLTLDNIVKPLAPGYRQNIWWGYQDREKSASSFVVIYARDADPNAAASGTFFAALNKGCNIVFSPVSNSSHVSTQCFEFPLQVFRVDALDGVGQPHLSSSQIAWIARIHRTPYFAKRANRLRYVMMNLSVPNPYMPGPPLVVVLEETPEWGWLIVDHQAHNETCNPAYYYANNGFNEKPPGCKAKVLPSPVP